VCATIKVRKIGQRGSEENGSMASAKKFRPQWANGQRRKQDQGRSSSSEAFPVRDTNNLRQLRPFSKSTEPAQFAKAHPTNQTDIVQALPRQSASPPWLKALLLLQRTSSVITFILVISLLAVYGWTVYTQQRWGQAYSRMEALQKQERQLMAANEVIKNQMAEQAEAPDVGLVLPQPGNTIFLTPAPSRPPIEPEVNLPPPQPIPARPLGY
jgi:hypothetical protein